MIPHNVMIGNLLRNIVPTIADLGERKQIPKKRSCSLEGQRREGYMEFASMIFHSHIDRLQRTNLVVVNSKFLEIDYYD